MQERMKERGNKQATAARKLRRQRRVPGGKRPQGQEQKKKKPDEMKAKKKCGGKHLWGQGNEYVLKGKRSSSSRPLTPTPHHTHTHPHPHTHTGLESKRPAYTHCILGKHY